MKEDLNELPEAVGSLVHRRKSCITFSRNADGTQITKDTVII